MERTLVMKLATAVALVALGAGSMALAQAAEDEGKPITGSVTFGGTYASVDGDEQKFREDLKMWDGLTAGVSAFKLHLPAEGWEMNVAGRALHPGDYGLNLELLKPDLGFARFDLNEFRSYYDSSNYFYNFAPFVYELDRDLFTTRRTTGLTLGLTPPDMPSVKLRVERWRKFGDASTYWGGPVTDGNITWNRYPHYMDVDQERNRVSLEVADTLGQFDLTIREQWEHFEGENKVSDQHFGSGGALEQIRYVDYEPDYTAWTTDLKLAGDLIEDVLRMEFIGQYRTASTDSTYGEQAFDAAGNPTSQDHAHNFVDNSHSGDSKLKLLNLRFIYTASEIATFFGGLGMKSEDTDSWALENSDTTNPPDGLVDRVERFDTHEERDVWMYNLGARVVPADWVVAQVDGRWERGDVTYDWMGNRLVGGTSSFRRLTDADYDRNEYTASVTVKPTRTVKLIGRCRVTNVDNAYDDIIDTEEFYPAYLGPNSRRIREWSASAQYRPSSCLWASYKLAVRDTDYNVRKEPVDNIATWNTLANNVSLNVAPTERLTLTGFGSHQNISLKTRASKAATAPIPNFDGDADTLGLSADYRVTDSTRLFAGLDRTCANSVYDYAFADWHLGFEHQINPTWCLSARFSHPTFDERGNGDIDDYRANVLSLALTGKF